jgi:hypothetical protein
MKVEGNILTIRVDLSKEFGPSSSGKTIIIASTEGNVSVTDRDEKVECVSQKTLMSPYGLVGESIQTDRRRSEIASISFML